MGRLTYYWNASLPFLLLLLQTSTDKAGAAANKRDIIFPGQLDHAEGEVCTTHLGKTGTCEHTCANLPTQGEPRRCGIKDSAFLVCCDQTLDNTTTRPGEPPQSQLDISPPSGYESLNCGRNAVQVIRADTLALRRVPPVVGGMISTRAAWPWVALLGRRGSAGISWFCGGALINEYWVLSALHCFLNNKADVVRLGEHDYNNDNDGASHKDFSVADLVLYPDYKAPEAYHDLALLKLASRVTLQEFIRPVCLPWGKKSEENIVNNVTTVVGWGNTLYGGLPSTVLMQADVQVFPSSRCESTYSKLPQYRTTWPHGIGKETLCAADPQGGKDACQGDSGGPLVFQDASERYVAAGIVSRGYGCGHMDYPGLYANLRHSPYLAWIKEVAFGHSDCMVA